jgi:hypothetical protein
MVNNVETIFKTIIIMSNLEKYRKVFSKYLSIEIKINTL